jgi:peptidoglycan/xylan/chitin deacetylase (PgdA/CDA1 family)
LIKFKPSFKQRLPCIVLVTILFLLLWLLLLNRYLIFQKTIMFFNKVDVSWMGYTDQKIVALTFDDGPDPVYTPQILKVLQKYHTPATFFILGSKAYQYPEIVKTEVNAGYLIGNHTYSHRRLSAISASAIRAEIDETDRVIKKISANKPDFFRPPYEELTDGVLKATFQLHKQILLSTITLEHQAAKTSKAKAERVIRLVFPGAIILAHDGRLNRSTTVKALPYLITGLTAKGYRIVSLLELLHEKP